MTSHEATYCAKETNTTSRAPVMVLIASSNGGNVMHVCMCTCMPAFIHTYIHAYTLHLTLLLDYLDKYAAMCRGFEWGTYPSQRCFERRPPMTMMSISDRMIESQ